MIRGEKRARAACAHPTQQLQIPKPPQRRRIGDAGRAGQGRTDRRRAVGGGALRAQGDVRGEAAGGRESGEVGGGGGAAAEGGGGRRAAGGGAGAPGGGAGGAGAGAGARRRAAAAPGADLRQTPATRRGGPRPDPRDPRAPPPPPGPGPGSGARAGAAAAPRGRHSVLVLVGACGSRSIINSADPAALLITRWESLN